MKKTLIILMMALFAISSQAQDYLEVGDQVSNFEFVTIEGDTVNIDELKGKVVYLNFFATWCGPCVKEMNMIKDGELKRFKKDDFYFVALGRGETNEKLNDFRERWGYSFNMATDEDKSLFARFSEKGIPLNVVLDQNSKVIYKETGFSKYSLKQMKKTIKKTIKAQ